MRTDVRCVRTVASDGGAGRAGAARRRAAPGAGAGAGAVRQLEGRRRSASRRGSAAPRIPVLTLDHGRAPW